MNLYDLGERVGGVKEKVDGVDEKIDRIEAKLDGFVSNCNKTEKRVDRIYWVGGLFPFVAGGVGWVAAQFDLLSRLFG
jgi:hypothetical protein